MGVGESHAHFGEAVNVRGLRLGIAAQMTYPMIQIIHGDEEDVGLHGFCGRGQAAGKSDQGEEEESDFHGKISPGCRTGFEGGFGRQHWPVRAM